MMMNKKVELTEVKEWVIVDRETGKLHYTETFQEALKSPIKGHVMTKHYYENDYKIIISGSINY